MSKIILLAVALLCLSSCDDVNPIAPSEGHAITRSGAPVELCADRTTRRKPC